MLKFTHFFDKNTLDNNLAKPNKNALDKVFHLLQEEIHQKKTGYYDLASDKRAIQDSNDFIQKNSTFLESIKNIVIIGIGGSSLGLKAIDGMLKHLESRKPIKLRFLEHTDPIEIQKNLSKISLKSTLFITISKSGTTIETSSLLKFVINKYNLMDSAYKKHLIFITDDFSPLWNFAQKNAFQCFGINKNIGGRFSILSTVGILPLKLLGYDVEKILEGAYNFQNNFLQRKEEHVLKKAIFLAKNKERYPINILFSYSSVFKNFNAWFVQLWGESLGKIDIYGKKVGLTPISLIGSIDQHSFLQLITQGVMDKTITFISLNQAKYTKPKIPNLSLEYLEDTNFVNGTSFAKLLNMQQIATMQAIQNEKIPTDCIEIDVLCENSVGKLIIYFELLTSAVGVILNINTYDQPGVEYGKVLLKKMF
ncbi:glucose-6-phosphate isomerase [Helicobacter sp. faydin-H20]|uniref:glucose-6-phosphate isomerase n=1 Tax=Helicobacter anatolicus TaxID=2905874 RepID=UPI001E53360C|nr:glucose-6-phosphate isomerase [Helicobacter anatolicus]MCE3036912.1 glucose-6-phosphate isomerase [Helicobacter anatolicus]